MLDKKIIEKIINSPREPFFERNILSDIFSWNELENILNLRPFASATRFKPASHENYSWELKNWLTDTNSYPPNLLADIIQKKVCHFCDASRVNFKINEICKIIEQETNSSSDAHIYFCLTDDFTQGFGVHYDLSDNLIVQVEGISNLKVWNNPIDPKFTNKKINHGVSKNEVLDEWNSVDRQIVLNVDLKKGDVIYIPSFYWHELTSVTKRLSVSFPFRCTNDLKNFLNDPQERDWIKLSGSVAESGLLQQS